MNSHNDSVICAIQVIGNRCLVTGQLDSRHLKTVQECGIVSGTGGSFEGEGNLGTRWSIGRADRE